MTFKLSRPRTPDCYVGNSPPLSPLPSSLPEDQEALQGQSSKIAGAAPNNDIVRTFPSASVTPLNLLSGPREPNCYVGDSPPLSPLPGYAPMVCTYSSTINPLNVLFSIQEENIPRRQSLPPCFAPVELGKQPKINS